VTSNTIKRLQVERAGADVLMAPGRQTSRGARGLRFRLEAFNFMAGSPNSVRWPAGGSGVSALA
jgi:hypothetical protein